MADFKERVFGDMADGQKVRGEGAYSKQRPNENARPIFVFTFVVSRLPLTFDFDPNKKMKAIALKQSFFFQGKNSTAVVP